MSPLLSAAKKQSKNQSNGPGGAARSHFCLMQLLESTHQRTKTALLVFLPIIDLVFFSNCPLPSLAAKPCCGACAAVARPVKCSSPRGRSRPCCFSPRVALLPSEVRDCLNFARLRWFLSARVVHAPAFFHTRSTAPKTSHSRPLHHRKKKHENNNNQKPRTPLRPQTHPTTPRAPKSPAARRAPPPPPPAPPPAARARSARAALCASAARAPALSTRARFKTAVR